MMSENITRLEIGDLENKSSELMILSIEEFMAEYKHIITRPHRINFYQMIMITGGEGNIWIDSNYYRFSDKSLITAAKGRVLNYDFGKLPKGYVILFSEEFINRNSGDLEWINSLNLFNQAAQFPAADLSEGDFNELSIYLKKIRTELELRTDYITEEIIFSLLKTLILVAERVNSKNINPFSESPNGSNYVFEFKKKLETMFNNSRTVNYYADQLGITPRKLNQVTLHTCGVSAKQLIEERVLLETKRLLTHTQLTIKEIGHSLGFNDPTNFNKFFKRYVKQTPLEFRELNRKYYKCNKTADIDHYQILSSSDN